MYSRNLIHFASFVIICLLLGCAAKKQTVKNEICVKFNVQNTEGFYVSEIDGVSDKNVLIILGKVNNTKSYSTGKFYGHIDVEIYGPDKKIIQRLSKPIEYRKIKKGSFHTSRFKIETSVSIQPGMVVVLTPHNKKETYIAE